MSSSWAVVEFLKALHRDREENGVRPLREYLARFRGHEEAVAREFVRAEAEPDAGPGDGELGADLTGKYRLVRVLGRGGQATVWLAEDERLHGQVAIEILDRSDAPAAAMRLLREAKLMSRLRDASICRVHDVGRVYVVMDYVAGPTLASLLEKRGGRRRRCRRTRGSTAAAASRACYASSRRSRARSTWRMPRAWSTAI